MASSGYASMELQAQVTLMQQENAVAGAVTAKGQMWKTALAELTQAAESMGRATDAIEPAWTDQAGTKFVGDTRQTKSGVDTFARNIETAKPDSALDAVAKGIGDTLKIVQENQQKAQQALAQAMAASPGGNAAALKEQIEKPFREANGQAMDSLDQLWDAATQAVQAAGGVGTEGQQASATGATSGGGGQSPGGGGGGGGGGGQQGAAGGDQQGQQGAAAGGQQDQQGQQGAGAGEQGAGEQGAGGMDNAAQPQDPGLAGGLGTAPPAPPPTVSPTVPPAAQIPPGGGITPVIPGGGIPGVGVGGSGQNSIPAAAAPISSPAVPTTGAAPAAPGAGGAPTSGTAVGGGGIPPMVPPMGAAGMSGGRAGSPGSGAVTRPGAARRREGSTPGLPEMLSGKAGKANPNAFAVRRRHTAAESDVPTTVQLIDEDLWQVPDTDPAVDRPPRR